VKIRALTNGNEIEVEDAAAFHLIDAGIYVPVDDAPDEKPARSDGQTLKRHKPRP